MNYQECADESPKPKKLIIACVATGVAIVALAIVLAVLCMNYYSEKETAAENQNTQATTAQNGTSSSNSNSNSSANSNKNNAAANENKGEDAQPQGSSEAQAEESQAQPEVETTEQRVAKLTQQLEGEGCTVVAQGEVRRHYDSSNTTYYVWLDQPCTVTGFQPGGYKTVSSQAIVASPSTNGTFSDKYEVEAYFSPIVGQRVLVGFTDGVEGVGFNTDVPCSLTQHTQSQCDLLNAGRVTRVSNIRIIEL